MEKRLNKRKRLKKGIHLSNKKLKPSVIEIEFVIKSSN
jgi:hypothetical protein